MGLTTPTSNSLWPPIILSVAVLFPLHASALTAREFSMAVTMLVTYDVHIKACTGERDATIAEGFAATLHSFDFDDVSRGIAWRERIASEEVAKAYYQSLYERGLSITQNSIASHQQSQRGRDPCSAETLRQVYEGARRVGEMTGHPSFTSQAEDVPR